MLSWQCRGDALGVSFEGLWIFGLEVKYRETVYRALEKLFDAGLVEKYYVKEKGLCYKIAVNRIVIDVTKGSIEKH